MNIGYLTAFTAGGVLIFIGLAVKAWKLDREKKARKRNIDAVRSRLAAKSQATNKIPSRTMSRSAAPVPKQPNTNITNSSDTFPQMMPNMMYYDETPQVSTHHEYQSGGGGDFSGGGASSSWSSSSSCDSYSSSSSDSCSSSSSFD